jgi:hypothetical protein
MNYARLDDGAVPDGIHPVRQAFQAVAHGHEHVVHAPVLDLGEHPQPVLGALAVAVLAGPQAQHVPLAVRGDADRGVDGPVGDLAVADLHVDDIDEQDRIHRVQRPVLPFDMYSMTRLVTLLISCFDTCAP